MYALGLYTTESCSDIWRNAALAAMAVPNCEEVRYTLHGKRYFSIGFRNVSGGYELRNRFFKGQPVTEGHFADG